MVLAQLVWNKVSKTRSYVQLRYQMLFLGKTDRSISHLQSQLPLINGLTGSVLIDHRPHLLFLEPSTKWTGQNTNYITTQLVHVRKEQKEGRKTWFLSDIWSSYRVSDVCLSFFTSVSLSVCLYIRLSVCLPILGLNWFIFLKWPMKAFI